MTFLAEERVLKPLDPVPADVNEWPDFALREVKIFYQGKGRYADLLEASEGVPLCVVGELMPLEDEQDDLSLIDDPEYQLVKIDNVTNYSFGQNDDGKPIVWAAGKAGWYEISPASKYAQHYHDTVEAIDLFYFMVDQYQKLGPKRRRLGFQIDPFLTAYQKHTNFTIHDDDEAMETIHKHHRFLLKQMIEEREGIDWSQTHLWKHLTETYMDELSQLRASLAAFPARDDMDTSEDSEEDRDASSVAMQNDAESVTSETDSEASAKGTEESEAEGASDSSEESGSDSGDESDDAESTEEAPSHEEKIDNIADQKAGSDASSKSAEDEEEESESDDDTDWTRPIFDLLNVLRKQTTFDIRNAGIDQLATEVQKMPSYPGNHQKAMATIEKFAEPLLRLMNEAKLRKKFNWSTRAIYAELEATLADEVAQDVKTPAGKGTKDRHRMKSVLRPSGASKSRKRTRGLQDEDEMMDEPPRTSNLPLMRRQAGHGLMGRNHREATADTVGSRDDSPSRQLNGYMDANALPELPPMPEAQEMLDLVRNEARRVGRQNQTGHLQAFLGALEQW